MSSVFFGVSDRYFSYSHVIGRSEPLGTGFRNPVDLALGKDDVIYVVNRSQEYRPEGVHVTVCTFTEQYITEFGSFGKEDGQFIWPVAIALDNKQNVYVADEYLSRISIFTPDGEFTRKWGKFGSGPGELNRPAGLAISEDGTVYVVDSRNHRVQKFTLDGHYLGQFGSFGSGPGQFHLPWGISLDKNGMVYIADWRNDRIQQLTPEGEFQASFGRPGNGASEFNRPSSVAVDQDGDIYVADWENQRVQVLTPTGRFITQFTGDAGFSQWARTKLLSSPDMIRQRNLVLDFTAQRVFWYPCAVRVDNQGRIAVLESARHRIQVYQKHQNPVLA